MSRRLLAAALAAGLLFAGCTSQLRDVVGGGASNDWALEMTQVDELRDRNLTGASVQLAIVDTGVDEGHAELEGVRVLWRDFVNGQSEPYDDGGHGTHVSGLAVAQGADGLNAPDVEGVAPGSTLLHAKAIEGSGDGEASEVAQGVDWAVANGADVLVLSLGGTPSRLPLTTNLENSVQDAIEEGVVVVAAAGNARDGGSGRDCDVASPADLRRVIAVGAVDRNGSIARFSCSGGSGGGGPLGLQERPDPHKKPELSAPGEGLIGPWPGRTCAGRAEARYCILSGTSQAAPIVGGIVALILEENPDLQRQGPDAIDRIKRALANTAEKRNFAGHHDRYGYGIVQGADALDRLG